MVLTEYSSRFTLHPSVSLASVAQKLPFTYTGADFYALCSDAMLKAVTRQATAVDAKVRALNADPQRAHPVSTAYYFDHFATKEDVAVTVTEADFLDAHEELIPSVSAGELAHYEKVRAMFEGGRGGDGEKKTTQQQLPHRPASRGSRPGTSGSLKGKGKAVAEDVNGGGGGGGGGGLNGKVNNKGKGKAVAVGFQDGTASDDDDLY